MKNTSERSTPFYIGHMQCTSITDGISYPEITSIPDRFPAVPRQALIEALKERHPSSETIPWSMNCLLVQTPVQNVLVDTGLGGDQGKLISRLKDSLPPAEIDSVIITHCHPDHIGGLVDEEGSLTFPNAEYFMWDSEWDYWMGQGGIVHQGDEGYAALLRAKLLPIEERLNLISEERELVPGIQAVSAPGHTPGHMALLIEDGDHSLLDLSDTLHTKVQLAHPDWSPRFDVDPHEAAKTRKALLARAAEEGLPTLLYHLGFPGLGRISTQGKGFAWQPWQTTQ